MSAPTRVSWRRAWSWVLAVAWIFVFAYYFLPAVADLTFTQTLAFVSLVVWALSASMEASVQRRLAFSWRRTSEDAFDTIDTLASCRCGSSSPTRIVTFDRRNGTVL